MQIPALKVQNTAHWSKIMKKIPKTGMSLYGMIRNDTGEYIRDIVPKRRRKVEEADRKEKCQEIFMIRFLLNNDIESLIFRYMDFNNIIYVSTNNIKEISAITGISKRGVYNHIDFLLESNVMLRVGKGLYFVNPEYAIKGAIFNRQAKMKADYYKIKSELANKPAKPKKVKLIKFKDAING